MSEEEEYGACVCCGKVLTKEDWLGSQGHHCQVCWNVEFAETKETESDLNNVIKILNEISKLEEKYASYGLSPSSQPFLEEIQAKLAKHFSEWARGEDRNLQKLWFNTGPHFKEAKQHLLKALMALNDLFNQENFLFDKYIEITKQANENEEASQCSK